MALFERIRMVGKGEGGRKGGREGGREGGRQGNRYRVLQGPTVLQFSIGGRTMALRSF